MSGLRFCFITTFYPPYNFGGDGIGIQRLARGLARFGHHVTVVHDVDAYNTLRQGAEPAPAPEVPGVEVVSLRSGLRCRLAAPDPAVRAAGGERRQDPPPAGPGGVRRD